MSENIFYLLCGSEVILNKKISLDLEEKFLVQEIYDIGEEEEGLGKPFLVDIIYKYPPTKRIATKILELEKQQKEVDAHVTQAKCNLYKIEEKIEQITKLREQYKPIDDMLNVLTFDAKYFVQDEFTIKSSYHLNHEAEFSVRIHCYKANGKQAEVVVEIDGGSVTPCVSEEKAIQLVKENILKRFKSHSCFISNELMKLAEKYNIPIPTDFLKKEILNEIQKAEYRHNCTRENYVSSQKTLDSLNAELESLNKANVDN